MTYYEAVPETSGAVHIFRVQLYQIQDGDGNGNRDLWRLRTCQSFSLELPLFMGNNIQTLYNAEKSPKFTVAVQLI